jgi:CRP-like cAMP-binding protein
MEKLIKLLQALMPMSPALVQHLRKIIKLFEYNKGETILEAGDTSDHILYIEDGLVISFYKLGQKQKEITNWFMGKGEIFISVLSFHRRTPSLDSHRALTACKFWGITHAELEETFRLFPEFERHGRILEAEYYCLSEERHIMLKRQPSDVKYQALMKQYPDLHKYATVAQLASFLNMSPRTFDYMRYKYNQENGTDSATGQE